MTTTAKKYNRSEIMKEAWNLVKKAYLSLSDALKMAWKKFKVIKMAKAQANSFYRHSESFNQYNIAVINCYGIEMRLAYYLKAKEDKNISTSKFEYLEENILNIKPFLHLI